MKLVGFIPTHCSSLQKHCSSLWRIGKHALQNTDLKSRFYSLRFLVVSIGCQNWGSGRWERTHLLELFVLTWWLGESHLFALWIHAENHNERGRKGEGAKEGREKERKWSENKLLGKCGIKGKFRNRSSVAVEKILSSNALHHIASHQVTLRSTTSHHITSRHITSHHI